MQDFSGPDFGYFEINRCAATGSGFDLAIAMLADGRQAALYAVPIRTQGWSTVVAVNGRPVRRGMKFWTHAADAVRPDDAVTVERWDGQRHNTTVTQLRRVFRWEDYE